MRFSKISLARKVAELTIKHSNLPESYIKRCSEVVEYVAPKLPQYRQIIVKRYKNLYDIDRPWSSEFQQYNYPLKSLTKKIWVEPVKNWCYFKGDRVEVLTGKDKGKQGIVVYIIQERNWVIVQGLNTYLAKVSKNPSFPPMSKEAPLLINREVALVDPTDLKPTKIEWRYDEKGNRVRVSVRTGRILPIPTMEEETYDYKIKAAYKDGKKDTTDKEISEVTFIPALQTFEMELMKEYNIMENRVPGRTYWY